MFKKKKKKKKKKGGGGGGGGERERERERWRGAKDETETQEKLRVLLYTLFSQLTYGRLSTEKKKKWRRQRGEGL